MKNVLQHINEGVGGAGPPVRTWWTRVDLEDGRTQIGGQFTEEQKLLLEREAERRGVLLSELLREIVTPHLDAGQVLVDQKTLARAMKRVGIYKEAQENP